MEVQRVILLFALAFILLLLYQRWLEQEAPAPTPPSVQSQEAAAGNTPPVPPAPDIPSTPAADLPNVPGAPVEAKAEAEEQARPVLTVETDLFRAEIDTLGGSIKRMALLDYPVSVDTPDEPFDLLKNEVADIFITQSGLIGNREDYPNHRTQFRVEGSHFRLREGEQILEVPLRWESGDGVKYTKKFIFERGSYSARIVFEVDNQGSEDWQGYIYAQFLRTQVVQSRGFFLDVVPSYLGGAIYTP